MNRSLPLLILALASAAGCSRDNDPRGVDRAETLLQVSATGRAEARPDEARFTAGVSSTEATAKAASSANNAAMQEVVAALQAAGIGEADIQTRNVGLSRIDYGPQRGRFRADNMVEVRIRDAARTGAAIAAATQAGANILSGPDLRVSDQESANRSAYVQAYAAARARADAYAKAAGLRVARVLAIREAGTQNGEIPPYPPRPVGIVAEQASAPPPPAIMPGTTASQVRIQADFALAE